MLSRIVFTLVAALCLAVCNSCNVATLVRCGNGCKSAVGPSRCSADQCLCDYGYCIHPLTKKCSGCTNITFVHTEGNAKVEITLTAVAHGHFNHRPLYQQVKNDKEPGTIDVYLYHCKKHEKWIVSTELASFNTECLGILTSKTNNAQIPVDLVFTGQSEGESPVTYETRCGDTPTPDQGKTLVGTFVIG